MPLPVVEILFDDISNYARCDSCGEIRLCERREEYIVDADESYCDGCHYVRMSGYGQKMSPTDIIKASNICHPCLGELQDDYMDELEKYSKLK